MAEIRLSGVNKVYPDGTHAVHDVDLHIADGEFMIMVGPSGCAKSTILRMIAGLETPTNGSIEIGGRLVNDVAPKDRDIAMVFQSYALYPHMTVRENMAFALRLRRMAPSEIDQRVAEAARILGLEHLLDRLPKAMSGGQRQRVAMGRAIVREPQAFLMDEPLSNLDAKLRVQMRTEIAKLHQRLSTTTVYVTHDQVEAMTLGQRICILRKGIIQQVDTPFQVYQNPRNVFVGGFIGSPGMNFMNGHLVLHEGALYLQLGDRHLPIPASVTSRLAATTDLHGRGVIVGIRPEHLSLTADGDPHGIPVHVELTEAMGAEVYAYFTAAVTAPDLTALADTQASAASFVARLAAGSETRGGEQILLRADMDEVHLFDPSSLQSLLIPADESEVRARQAGRAVQLAGGTASRQPSPVAAPPSAGAQQPMQPVIHLHQTFMHGEHAPTTQPAAGRIESVFDQPVPAPIGLEPLVPRAADGSHGASTHARPRPTFARHVAGGTSLDPTWPSAPQANVPGADHEPMATREAQASAPQPVAHAQPAATPEPPPQRGFAPRVIGPAAVASAGAAEASRREEPTIQLGPAALDQAVDALQAAEEIDGVVPVMQPFADAAGEPEAGARPLQSSGFREALERIRNPGLAPAAPPLPRGTTAAAEADRQAAPPATAPIVVRPPRLGGDAAHEPPRN